MVPRRRISSCLVLFSLCVAALSSQERQYPSGFSGTVTAMAYSSPLSLVFLGEKQGFITAYDPQARKVVFRYQVALNTIMLIACHPVRNELAVVASDGIGKHSLSILSLDGTRPELVKVINLMDKPESIAFSPKGGILAISAMNAKGVLLKETAEYETLEGFPSDCGPSTFVTIGNSENSLMYYAPKGRFVYRALPSGAIISEAKTQESLSNIALATDKKSAYALSAGNLLKIDAVSGRTLGGPIQKNVLSFMLTPDSCLCALGDGSLLPIKLSDGSSGQAVVSARRGFASMLDCGSTLLGITVEGNALIAEKSILSAFSRIDPEPYIPINHFSAYAYSGRNGFVLPVGDALYFLDENSPWKEEGDVAELMKTYPGEALGHIGVSGSQAFVSATRGSETFVHPLQGEAGASGSAFRVPGVLKRVNSSQYGSVYILQNESYGLIKAASVSQPFSTLNGLQDAASISKEKIAIARNKGGSLSSPLLFYSTATGEISPSGLDAISVFKLASMGDGRFASLSIEAVDGQIMTAVRICAVSPFSSQRIAAASGEHFDADFGIGPDGRVFIALGDNREILVWGKGANIASIPLEDFPRSVSVGERYLCVSFVDGSLCSVDLSTEQTSGRFAFTKESGWFRLPR